MPQWYGCPTVRPREIYQREIANALVDAIVDYKERIGIAANEWLTVAARELRRAGASAVYPLVLAVR